MSADDLKASGAELRMEYSVFELTQRGDLAVEPYRLQAVKSGFALRVEAVEWFSRQKASQFKGMYVILPVYTLHN